jgi:tetratricopeptide (TPR) repeat protein
MARLCACNPDAGTDVKVPMALMQQALARSPNRAWYLHTCGLLHYRAGRYEDAAEQFQAALAKHPDWDAHVLNHLGLALACHRLGKAEAAQKWWTLAKRWMDEPPQATAGQRAPLRLDPHDWLGCLLLRREADQCFGAVKPNEKPAAPPPGAAN